MQAESWYWQKTWASFRRGSRRLRVSWPGGNAVAQVFDEGAPITSAAFLARLPLEIQVVHVAWSGDMVMGAQPVPLGVEAEENLTRLVRPGDIAYDPKYNEITVTYGTAEARLPSGPNTLTVFGALEQGLEEFARWGRARRFEGVGTVRFELIGGSE
jgi:hypothetical protein